MQITLSPLDIEAASSAEVFLKFNLQKASQSEGQPLLCESPDDLLHCGDYVHETVCYSELTYQARGS